MSLGPFNGLCSCSVRVRSAFAYNEVVHEFCSYKPIRPNAATISTSFLGIVYVYVRVFTTYYMIVCFAVT